MTLTTEELRAVEAGQRVRFRQNGGEFVVLRSEEFEQLAARCDEDHQEPRLMLARSSEASGWDEPGMEVYDSQPGST